jgi:putative component of membrane protein insertase Oxa1/YidC/SpoIIIJ protein YidD
LKKFIFLCVLLFDVPVLASEREMKEFLASPGTIAIEVYQRWVSPAKGSSCPMSPSDSAYARQAVRKNGIIIGMLQGFDRLHRCGHDLEKYPLVTTPTGLRYADPVP